MIQFFVVLSFSIIIARADVDKTPIYEWYKGLEPENVLFAINCGSNTPLIDMAGINYDADKGYSSGSSSDSGSSQRWVVPNSEIYHTERWHDENFSYKVPIDISKEGIYTLILKFSEQYFNEPNYKIFDVQLGEHRILSQLDIVARAGTKLLPYDTFHQLEVKDRKIFYEGREIKQAMTSPGFMKVDFIKGSYDNPKINAILLVKGGVDATHKKNF